jgi:hypothetical protein
MYSGSVGHLFIVLRASDEIPPYEEEGHHALHKSVGRPHNIYLLNTVRIFHLILKVFHMCGFPAGTQCWNVEFRFRHLTFIQQCVPARLVKNRRGTLLIFSGQEVKGQFTLDIKLNMYSLLIILRTLGLKVIKLGKLHHRVHPRDTMTLIDFEFKRSRVKLGIGIHWPLMTRSWEPFPWQTLPVSDDVIYTAQITLYVAQKNPSFFKDCKLRA